MFFLKSCYSSLDVCENIEKLEGNVASKDYFGNFSVTNKTGLNATVNKGENENGNSQNNLDFFQTTIFSDF